MNYASRKEQVRLEILQDFLAKKITRREGAERLGLSTKQFSRILARLQAEGPGGLTHRRKGCRPANRLPDELGAQITELLTERYSGMSLLQAHAQITELERISVSYSTLRRIRLAARLDQPRPEPEDQAS